MQRVVRDEILDTLPHTHPDAMRSRRDLRVLNWLMGNYRWMRRQLKIHGKSLDRALELGAGLGDFQRHMSRRNEDTIKIDALDLCPKPADWPESRRWWQDDIKQFDRYDDYTVILANLILHHFTDVELLAIGQKISRHARLILACEPSRRTLHGMQLKVLGCLGLGPVTKRDGAVSIQAGFRSSELPQALGLDPSRWQWNCRSGLRGQYFMIAIRVA